MENKVKFGVSQLTIFPEKDNGEGWDAPISIPGIVNIGLEPSGSAASFFAQNIPYFVQTKNNGYTGDMEVALFPDDVLVKLLGWYKDENGNYVEDSDGTTRKFALGYQVEGDVKARRVVLYDCEIARPSTSAQTTEDSITPQTDTVSITVVPKYFDELGKNVVRAWCYEGDASYGQFFTSVVEPGDVAHD